MKKTLSIAVLSTLSLGLFARNSPVTIPDIGNARLQNVSNLINALGNITAGAYDYKYSNHDAVLVGLRLGEQQGENIESVSTTAPARKILHNEQTLTKLNSRPHTITGTRIQ